MRRGRWKRKNVSAGRSAPARTSCRRRGKAGAPSRQSGTETRGHWGILWPGEIRDTCSFSFRCRWPSLAGQGPTHRSAPTKRWEALTFRRGGPACPPVGKAPRGTMKRQRGQKQGPCDFPPRRPPHRIRGSRPGKMSGSARAGRRPEVLPAPTRETLVRAEGHCTGARQKSGLFFWTGPRPIFFSTRLKRKWGAECLSQHPG